MKALLAFLVLVSIVAVFAIFIAARQAEQTAAVWEYVGNAIIPILENVK